MNLELKNPILPGFYPDPSICRVEDDFYLITSSFSYFPGIPIFHSRDLVHWEQIGYALERPSQFPNTPYDISGGIYAPTIRYHEGIFYIITTNVYYGGNFIITAEKPEGPWSEPHYLENAEGYDPELFWDNDGKSYLVAAHTPPLAVSSTQPVIYIREIDLENYRFVGEPVDLWGGSLAEPLWPEAPHIYKVNDYYYLLIAEGETEHFHSVSIARSKELKGPYQSYKGNPVLTQRHLGMHVSIANTGHADMIELKDGSWYAVFLASRPYGGYHKNLGRETFIVPVTWEEEWPVFNSGYGTIQFTYKGPDLPEYPIKSLSVKDDFNDKTLGMCWNYLGTPKEDTCILEDSCLKIKMSKFSIGKGMREKKERQKGYIEKTEVLGFVGRRQQHMSFVCSAKLIFSPKERMTAGIVMLQNAYQQLRIEIGLNDRNEKVVRVVRGYHSLEWSLVHKDDSGEYREEVIKEILWVSETAIFQIVAKMQKLTLSVTDGGNINHFLVTTDGSFLGSETAGGFVGTYIGMFASGNGKEYDEYAAFDWFYYEGLES